MHKLVTDRGSKNEKLEVEHRNLLSVAYKNVVGSKRSSWRTLSSGSFSETDGELVKEFKAALEKELKDTCDEVINLLKTLLKSCGDKEDETKVFYLKMKGDYYRYLSEFDTDETHKTNTKDSYEAAMVSAKAALPETHPTRLGLALNFSVCYYEILKMPEKACELAKEAFDAAIEKLDTLNDASYKDSTLIMQLLRDNLTLWSQGAEEADKDKADN